MRCVNLQGTLYSRDIVSRDHPPYFDNLAP